MKAARARDRPCSFEGCNELVRRSSQYCRHHLGMLHGAASARTFGCSEVCQSKHQRCPACQALCGGGHVRRLRDGVCYQVGAPSCWSQLHTAQRDHLVLWTITCLICSRSAEFLTAPPPARYRCEQCGSALLEAEALPITGGLRLLRGTQFAHKLVKKAPSGRYTPEAGAGQAISL